MPFILNVDDYAPGRYMRTKILTQAGFEVREAATGHDALRIAREKPQLIVLDVNLPDIGGFEVCRQVKQNPETAGTIVLHLSASSLLPEHRIAGLDGGADGYLTEPISPEVLVATVRALLRAHSAEEALRFTNDRLQQYAIMIAHELLEPLRGVETCSQILGQKTAERLNVSEQQALTQIRANADLMRKRINSILEYSRAEQNGSDVRNVSAQEVLDECLDELQLIIAESRTEIHVVAPLPSVRVNRTGLARVFSNLITNAIRYKGKSDAVIVISAALQGEFVLFSVRDNGIGIEPRFHRQIFDPFQRLQSSESGSGLGLAVCRSVITSSGGEIWVDSAAGAGSTFYFTLPAARTNANS